MINEFTALMNVNVQKEAHNSPHQLVCLFLALNHTNAIPELFQNKNRRKKLDKGAVIFNPGYQGGGSGRGMKLFSTILWGYENFKSNFHGVQNYFA